MARLWIKKGVVISAFALAALGITVMLPKQEKANDIRLHAYAHNDSVKCTITKVVDGDTFKCLVLDSVPITIRLACIDAPEKAQPFGSYSSLYLTRLLQGNNTYLIKPYNTMDRYGRYVCVVSSDSGNVNLKMVRQGMAFVYYDYCKDDTYTIAEQQAFNKQIGVHSITMVKPWDYRRNK